MSRNPGRPVPRAALPTALAALLVAGSAACASSGPARTGTAAAETWGAPTSEAAVRGFLAAANAEDYGAMSALFGTPEGAIVRRDGPVQVEQRMIFLARLLRHDALSLRRADLASAGPGRARYEARLTTRRRGEVLVPVVAVPGPDDRWYVEKLDLDAFSSGT
ncbi:MAG: hypothetical protein RRA92_00100 [Gemmatimonadota bacterium]|nr:hypothetical protein [Gemmatimonadota bacterium]